MLTSEYERMLKALNKTVNELRGELRERESEIEALTIDVKILQDEIQRLRKLDPAQR